VDVGKEREKETKIGVYEVVFLYHPALRNCTDKMRYKGFVGVYVYTGYG